jgi:glutathione peroxidase-family protein
MKKLILSVLLLVGSFAAAVEPDFYSFKVKKSDNSEQSMADFKDKVVLVVNVASRCGFTPQYAGLEELYKKYHDQGLVIVGFPCNQFAGQEPGSNEEIQKFCKTNYGVEFPVMAKIDVNGDKTDPLYVWLKKQASGTLGTEAIKWNFTKFLVDRKGKVLERFASANKPETMTTAIEKALAAK